MSLSLKDYMECVSLSLTGKPLDLPTFFRRVLDNGGYDMHEISVEDIVHLYNEEFSNCDRDEVLWAFAETIDIYKFVPETPEDICCGIFTLIVLSLVSAQNKDDYLNNYDKIIEMFYFFHQRIESGISMLLFSMCFPNPPEYPEIASGRLEKAKRKKNSEYSPHLPKLVNE